MGDPGDSRKRQGSALLGKELTPELRMPPSWYILNRGAGSKGKADPELGLSVE